MTQLKRRGFLQLLAAAPLAALVPWRPSAFVGVDLAAAGDATMWFIVWDEERTYGIYERELVRHVVKCFGLDPEQLVCK